MGKKASARIKNKVKALVARSIAHLEKTVGRERRPDQQVRHKSPKRD